MKTSTLACLAGSLVAATALAGPDPTPATSGGKFIQSNNAPTTGGIDAPLVDDDFESYTVGGGIMGMNGWEGWFSTGPDIIVSNAQAASGSQSILYEANSGDVVQDFKAQGTMPTSGSLTFSCMSYTDSGATGRGFVIMLNDYGQTAAECDWSSQIAIDPIVGTAEDLSTAGTTSPQTVLYDQWVEIVVNIDLDTNEFDGWYNGLALQNALTNWYGGNNGTSGTAGIGGQQVACLDMFSDGGTDIYMDDVLMDGGTTVCYADCDSSGGLNILDYICFGDDYAAGGTYADCDNSGGLNILDYICFGDAYAAGCP